MKTLLSIIVLSAFFLNSCSHYYYAPNEGHLLGISEKGEIKISGGTLTRTPLFSDATMTQSSFSAAGSPYPHLALAFNYLHTVGKTQGEQNNAGPSGKGKIIDFAAGTYYRFPERESKFKGLLDCYIGYGWGNARNHYEDFSSSFVRFRRPFLQTGSHVFFKERISLGLGLRLAKLTYQEITYTHSTESVDIDPDLLYLQTNNPLFLLEIGMNLQIGFRHVKGFWSVTTTSAPNAEDFQALTDTFVAGFLVDIDEFFKKKHD